MEKTYNGWTNYATWRVNLEIFDSMELGDFWGYENDKPSEIDPYELGETMKDYANELLEIEVKDGLALDYARAFISDVNWREIAEMMLEAYAEQKAGIK